MKAGKKQNNGLFIAGATWKGDSVYGYNWFSVRLGLADIRRIRQLAKAAGRLKAGCISESWSAVSIHDALPVRPGDADIFVDENDLAEGEEPGSPDEARVDIASCDLCVSEHWVYWEVSTWRGERVETQGCSLAVIEEALNKKGGKREEVDCDSVVP